MLVRPRSVLPALLATAALGLGVGVLSCDRTPPGPEWMKGAPSQAKLALSAKAGWFLEHKEFQTMLAQVPVADQALDLFLRKARINPATETGRITLYAANLDKAMIPGGDAQAHAEEAAANFLMQLDSFQDPKALQAALAESFPPEGSMRIDGRDCPLFVILDINQFHFRAATDGKGRIWIGDLKALQRRANDQAPAPRSPLARCAAWIDPGAPVQGFIAPEGWLDKTAQHLPAEIAREIPKGISAIAWSVAPGAAAKDGHKLELALAGTPEGIAQATPWLQRLVALTNALPNAPSVAPELIQERERVALRCTLTGPQIESLMSRLGVPGLKLKPGGPAA
jgi:hypothetical protein